MSTVVAADPGTTPPGPAGERRAAGVDVAVIGVFVVLALWVMRNLWADPAHLDVAANATDQTQFEYFLEHAVRVVTGGEHPFFTHQLNAPVGVNLMANTALLGLT